MLRRDFLGSVLGLFVCGTEFRIAEAPKPKLRPFQMGIKCGTKYIQCPTIIDIVALKTGYKFICESLHCTKSVVLGPECKLYTGEGKEIWKSELPRAQTLC